MRLVVAVSALLAPLALAAPPECVTGVFLPRGTPTIRGLPITGIEISGEEPLRLRVYGAVGQLACEGTILPGRHVRARLDTCLADAGSSSTCWCSPAVIRLKVTSTCSVLRGSARFAGRRRRLAARPGFCGDGFIDRTTEECDGGRLFGCSFPAECGDDCRCADASPTR